MKQGGKPGKKGGWGMGGGREVDSKVINLESVATSLTARAVNETLQ
jgi:hypothetical protein